jgi:hypothetical protein
MTEEDKEFAPLLRKNNKIADLEAELAALRATVERVLTAIDTGFPTVLGLPCICDTPELHSEECVVIRKIFAALPLEAGKTEPNEAGKPKCPTCGGSGTGERSDASEGKFGSLTCPACNGSGEATTPWNGGR